MTRDSNLNYASHPVRRYYTEEEARKIARQRRRKKWRMFKHFMVDFALVALIIFAIVAFSLLYYVIAALSVKTTINFKEIEVGTMTRENFVPLNTTLFGYDVTRYGSVSDDIDFDKVGTYLIKYKTILSSHERTAYVSIVDSTAPNLTLFGDAIIYAPNLDEFVDPGFTCYDNYDGNLTNSVKVETKRVNSSEYSVKYSVEDSSGNQTIAERKLYLENVTTIYLTFDDGPSSSITPQILEILDRYGVSATFFVLGLDDAGEDLVRQAVQSGHTVGMHGYSHEYSQIYSSVDACMDNFYTVERQIYDATGGYDSKIIRFPGGSSNTVSKNYCDGVMSSATQRAISEGYAYFDWNVDSGDSAGAYSSAYDIYVNVVCGIKYDKANVILLHDGAGHQATADALERIIKYCLDHGFVFRTLNTQSKPVRHGVSN